EVYQLTGDKKQSLAAANTIIAGMEKAAKALANGDSSGHYADREMAYAYLDVANYEKAMDHALLEYNRRPKNIDVNETLAWVYYRKGDYKNAQLYINTALKTDCKNPALLCHVGLIYAKAGDKANAKNYLQQALKNNPNISPLLKSEAQQVLRS